MSTSAGNSTPAGFYPDKDGRQRYWDGNAWTDRTADGGGKVTAGAAEPKQRRRWLWPLIAVATFVLGLVIASAGKSTPTTTISAPAVPTVTATATVTGGAAPAPPAQTVTVTVTPSAPPSPPGPATSFADGTLVVGTDIQPGTYKAPNPDGVCYFARLKGTGGGFDDIIANGNPSGPVTVTIKATDKAFESTRCGGWTKVG